MTIPVTIAALLPLFATILSSWLNDDGFKPGVNAIIALVAILATATGCELLAGNFTGNYAASFLGVLGYVGVLMAGDLNVLYQYLIVKQSPISKALGGPPTPPTPAKPAPTPIMLKGYQPTEVSQVSTPPQGGSGIIPAPAAPPAQPMTPEQVA